MKKLNRRKFVLGYTSNGEAIGMEKSQRPEHLIIYGVDTRAKEAMMIELAKSATQQAGGATFVVETPQLAGAIYKILSDGRKKRPLFWLNPELSLGIKNQGLWLEEYDEITMDQYVFNYQEKIESGAFVIIDMETLANGKNAERLKRHLLNHLSRKLMKASPTKHAGHDFYMEAIEGYHEEIKPLIVYGASANCSVRLLAETPNVFKDSLPLVGAYFKHVVLLPQFHIADADYYKSILSLDQDKVLFNRKEDVAIYSTRNQVGAKKLISFILPNLDFQELTQIVANGKRCRAGLLANFVSEEHENNEILAIKENGIEEQDDWKKTTQMLVALSSPSIPKHPDMELSELIHKDS